jgi:uncharacterized protein with von Willebrand factor type A (vWA) domain
MLDVLQGFVHELRAAGLPVSMTENLDAMRAVEHIDLAERDTFKAALGATLVKHHRHWSAFETVFDVYFSLWSAGVGGVDDDDPFAELLKGQPASDGSAMGEVTPEELAAMLLNALMSNDQDQLRAIAAAAVTMFAGMEPGRPVGGTYYLYRTLRQLDYDGLLARMQARAAAQDDAPDALSEIDDRLQREAFEAQLRELRDLVEQEIRRRLVADRGVEAMARTLRKPLTRAWAARLAQRRRRRNRGALDFRQTVRHSLSYGGVPAELKFRAPKPTKPDIMVVADISGSVASFARFTLQFVYAMAGQFSKVRSFVFIDGIDEVTRFFAEADDIADAIHRVNTEADVVWVDGHSDYGHAFEVFDDKFSHEITPKTSVILLGDARNNYHTTQAALLKGWRVRARRLYWLNPEPRSYWDTGDSVVSDYGVFCDGVFECRNLRQLERFVAAIVEP